ncbi:MAG: helix-turn-helix transcriptional regulator [Bacteroidales bacterium]|nr:helix-turn-helix transcriptional regulator [Bacteroidales bacterium]
MTMTGPEINDVLQKLRDRAREGETCVSPDFAERYTEAAAQLAKSIEAAPDVGHALKYVLVDVMDKSLWDVAIDIGVHPNTVAKYVAGTRRPEAGTALAICLDVNLPPQITRTVLKKMHYAFVPGNRRDTAYLMLADHCWASGDIAKMNAILVSQGLKPMTKKLPSEGRPSSKS